MYGGLSYGGAHRQMIRLLCALDKTKYRIVYFWCVPKPDLNSTFVWPELDYSNIKLLESNGIEVVEFTSNGRDVAKKYHPWIDTNFFEIFKKYKTDLIFSSRAGYPEYPFVKLREPIVEWNVFGCVDNSSNLVYSVHSSDWTFNAWSRQNPNCRGEVIYPPVPNPVGIESFKEELKIELEDIVLGFHQRDDDHIYGEQAMRAYAILRPEVARNAKFVVLGGSEKYKMLASKLGINVHFLPIAKDYRDVSKFLNTLDIFTHTGGAGETLAITVQEAMIHGLPVVTMRLEDVPNGQIETLHGAGLVVNTIEEYSMAICELIQNDKKRSDLGSFAKQIAIDNYNYKIAVDKFDRVFNEISKKYINVKFRKSITVCLNEFFGDNELWLSLLNILRRIKNAI